MSDQDLDHAHRRLDRLEARFWGKYAGFVVDNADPKKLGRLRLQIPEVLGTDVTSGWADPCFGYGGGNNFGTFSVPPVCKSSDGKAYTTGVWVEFRGGNPQFPIWVGTFYGAPADDTSEAPGDDATADVEVHVERSFAGHSIVAVDSAGKERLELRDAAGQKLTFSGPLKNNTKRDDKGAPKKATKEVDYPDLAADTASVTLSDVAGNAVLLDATKSKPSVTITNKSKDGKVLQTVQMIGAGDDAKIVITDANKNVVTLSKTGIQIDALGGSDTAVTLDAKGITGKGKKINLNNGSMGAARLNDQIMSAMADDPSFWGWMKALDVWTKTHVHNATAPGAPTSPPVTPVAMAAPSTVTGKITKGSGTVVIGG